MESLFYLNTWAASPRHWIFFKLDEKFPTTIYSFIGNIRHSQIQSTRELPGNHLALVRKLNKELDN